MADDLGVFVASARRVMAAAPPENRLKAFCELCRGAMHLLKSGVEKTDIMAAMQATGEDAGLSTSDIQSALEAAVVNPFDPAAKKPNGSHIARKAPVPEQWPQPLGGEAFHGIAGELVTALAPHTEADSFAVLLQFLAAFGNVCGRRAYLQIEGDRHPAQLWPVLVGKTAKGRKGTSWGRVRELMALVDQKWVNERVISGLSTGEGLVYAVRDPVITKGKEGENEIDAGVDDKRLLVVESEFASPLRHMERGGNILSSTLRAIWDTGSGGSLTKNSATRTTGSMVTVIGHVTVEELRRYLTRTERANGLANRFLFGMVRRSKRLPFGGGDFNPEPFVDRLKEAVARAWTDQRIGWQDDARKIWAAEYGDLSEGKAGMAGAITSRAETQVLRLALTYALLDGSPEIGAAHLKAGLAVWRYCEQSAWIVFGSLTGNPVADDILAALKPAKGGATRTEIHNAFGRHKTSEMLTNGLRELEAAGFARSETRQTAGRPEERWFAV